jgi:hypothetical protein
LKTLSTNIAAHKSGIPLHSLPLTFAESVDFLKRLGIRYLWIDSLCIIQDDILDWQKQAAEMASIYENAHLVLSASKAYDAEDGLYSSLAPDFALHSITYRHDDDAPTETLCFRRAITHLPDYKDRRFDLRTASFPTLHRAWIFQERFLAKRVLHFGFQELIWECHESTTCQCRDGNTLHSSTSPTTQGVLDKHVDHISHPKSYFGVSALSLQGHVNLQQRWHRLVEEYTKLSMSYQGDVYPAISGLARVFHSRLQTRYCAGLWEGGFISDMVWHVQPTFETQDKWSARPEPWRAPSWSWASILSPAKYLSDAGGFTPFCTLVSVTCLPSGQDAMGQLLSAEALIKCRILRTTLRYRKLQGQQSKAPWNLLDLELARDRVANVWADYDCALPGTNHLPPDSEILVLMLGEKTLSRALEGLMLTSSKSGSADEMLYKRIGLVEFSRPPGLAGEGFEPWLKYLNCTGEESKVRIV